MRSRIEVLSAQVLEHVRSIEEEDVLVVAGRGAGKRLWRSSLSWQAFWEDSCALQGPWWRPAMAIRPTRSDCQAVQ